MRTRPRSVTIISGLLIAFGGLALIVGLLPKLPTAEDRLAILRSEHPIRYALLYLGPVFAVLCGVLMLRGLGWARWLLVVWFGSNVLGNLSKSPVRFLLPSVLFAIAVYLLFRPEASAFFRRPNNAITGRDEHPTG